MSLETVLAEASGRPDIHIWMSETEAAAMLGTSESLLNCQIELGELETRFNAGGAREVLVCLPRRERANETSTGLPESARGESAGRAGWVVAVVVLAVACSAGLLATRLLLAARQQERELSAQVDQLTSSAAGFATERNQLLQQLSEAHQAVAKAEGDLAVERKIEDTLIQGALAAKAKTAAATQPSQLADGAE